MTHSDYTMVLWAKEGRQRYFINQGERQVGWFDPSTGEKGIRDGAEAWEVDTALEDFGFLRADPVEEEDRPVGEELIGPEDLAETRPGDLVPGEGWKHVMGVEGELQTAGMLSVLAARGCRMLHSVRMLGEKDIDHIVIGPTGVFTINSKKTSYPVDIGASGEVKVSGYRQDWHGDAERDGRIVERRLSETTGIDLPVEGLVSVWTGTEPITGFHQQIVPGDEIIEAITNRPVILSEAAVEVAYSIARLPGTWS